MKIWMSPNYILGFQWIFWVSATKIWSLNEKLIIWGVSNEKLGVSNEKLGLSNEMAKQILWPSMNLFGCPMKILGSATKLWSLNKKLRVSNDNLGVSN